MSDNKNVEKVPLNEESLSHYFDDGDLDEWLLDDDRFSHEFDETWNKNISLMEKSIETCVYGNINWDLGEYQMMKYEGLTEDQKDNINRCILDGLIKLTHDVEWSKLVAYNIVVGIEGSIKSMMITNIWNNFYDNHHQTDITKWILNNIKYQLNGEELFPSILSHKLWQTREDCFAKFDDRYLQRVEVCLIAVKYKIPDDLIPTIIAYAIPYSKIYDYMK